VRHLRRRGRGDRLLGEDLLETTFFHRGVALAMGERSTPAKKAGPKKARARSARVNRRRRRRMLVADQPTSLSPSRATGARFERPHALPATALLRDRHRPAPRPPPPCSAPCFVGPLSPLTRRNTGAASPLNAGPVALPCGSLPLARRPRRSPDTRTGTSANRSDRAASPHQTGREPAPRRLRGRLG